MAVTKRQGVDSGGGERIAQSELVKLSNLLPRWRRVFVMGAVLLLVALLIILIGIVGIQQEWWAR